jgi:hypothetical protein
VLGSVQDGAVLDVGVISDSDLVDVAWEKEGEKGKGGGGLSVKTRRRPEKASASPPPFSLSLSPRITALYHTDARAPSVTSPMTDAPGATKAPSPREGEAPAKGCRVRWEETEVERVGGGQRREMIRGGA